MPSQRGPPGAATTVDPRRNESPRSAACASSTVPTIATPQSNRRSMAWPFLTELPKLPRSSDINLNGALAGLIQRKAEGLSRRMDQSPKPSLEALPRRAPQDKELCRKRKRRGGCPRRRSSVKERRSAFAHQRRRVDRLLLFGLEHPAHAELEVMRVELAQGVEGARSAAGRASAIGAVDDGGIDVAEVEITVGQLHLEVVGDIVGEAGVDRPGEFPFGEVVVRRKAEAGGAVGDEADIAEAAERVARIAGADADERGQAHPGAEIDVGVGHQHGGGMVSVINVEAAPARAELGVAADHLELRLGAILGSRIEAQPGIPLEADAAADEG